MDVIASTAFGIDVDVQETTDHEFIYHAKKFFGIPTDDRIITRIKSFFNILSSCKYLDVLVYKYYTLDLLYLI